MEKQITSEGLNMFNVKLYETRDGHKFFKNQKGEISICDHSGDFPEDTDDGPLIVHPGAHCLICHGSYGLSVRVTVWVKRTNEIGYVSLTVNDFQWLRRNGPKLDIEMDDTFRKLAQKVLDLIGISI